MNSIIDKIKKLRQLSQSSNLNEASNASAAAEKLIQEHRIAEAELIEEQEESIETDYVVEDTSRAITWRGQLIIALAKSYSCCTYQTIKFNQETNKNTIAYALVGTKTDTETCKYQYVYLAAEIVRLAHAYSPSLSGKSDFNSFYLGAVFGIKKAMDAANEAVRVQASSSALIKLDQRLVRAKEAITIPLKSKQTSSKYNPDAYYAGKSAGEKIHRGASLGSGTKLLGDGK